MDSKKHQEMLKKYAEAVVRVGLNLRKGQRLAITYAATRGVPFEFAPLARAIAEAAYQAGARYVDIIWGDEQMLPLRAHHAPKDSFGEYSKWQIQAILDALQNDGALLTIVGSNPDLMGSIDPEIAGQMQKAHLENWGPITKFVMNNAINWCLVSYPGEAWAKKIFPKLESEKAVAKLWKAIFETNRIDQPDPIKAWEKHIVNLRARANFLHHKQFTGLHYKAPGTDFTLGLPAGHKWISAQSMAQNGVPFTANMPTEEVFTLPDRNRADGVVSSTFPLSYGGILIEDFQLTFENGRIVKVSAKKGEVALQRLVDTDEGSHRLGEVALVPASSPIAKRGHLFYNTLFDENASCHIAIGRAYRFTMIGGEELNDEEFMAQGGNTSLNHVDFMIGSAKMDIDGIHKDGTREPVMRKGEWAFKS